MDGLQDPLSRLSRLITAPLQRRKNKARQLEDDDLVLQPLGL